MSNQLQVLIHNWNQSRNRFLNLQENKISRSLHASPLSRLNWNLKMLFFFWRDDWKAENTLRAWREPTTNSAQIWPRWREALLSCKNAWNDLQRTHLQIRFYSGTYLLLTLQMRLYSANKTVYFNLARVPGGLNVEGKKIHRVLTGLARSSDGSIWKARLRILQRMNILKNFASIYQVRCWSLSLNYDPLVQFCSVITLL